jgi:hypothetical protein
VTPINGVLCRRHGLVEVLSALMLSSRFVRVRLPDPLASRAIAVWNEQPDAGVRFIADLYSVHYHFSRSFLGSRCGVRPTWVPAERGAPGAEGETERTVRCCERLQPRLVLT